MVTMTLVMVIIMAMTIGYTDDAGDDFVIAMMVNYAVNDGGHDFTYSNDGGNYFGDGHDDGGSFNDGNYGWWWP